MHRWGDPDVDWNGIEDAADYIGDYLAQWGRINVRQTKEKYGTVRVYCDFGASGLYWLVRPRYIYYRWPLWLRWTSFKHGGFWTQVNKLLVPWQKWIYRRGYAKALAKWPHLRDEILVYSDYPELLGDL